MIEATAGSLILLRTKSLTNLMDYFSNHTHTRRPQGASYYYEQNHLQTLWITSQITHTRGDRREPHTTTNKITYKPYGLLLKYIYY